MPLQFLGQPGDRQGRRAQSRVPRRITSVRKILNRRPDSCVFEIAAKLLKAETTVRALEHIDASIVAGVLDAVDDNPGGVDTFGQSLIPISADVDTQS